MLFSNQTNSISEQNVQRLARCRGWALTLAIFLFLYSGLLILGVLGSLMGPSGGGFEGLSLFINLIMSGLYIAAGVNLCKFFGHIRKAADTLNAFSLEFALKSQAKAWLWIGICAILYFIATLIILAVTVFS